ncbi:MAG TPA: prolyl oligopeptidase family serine peptidase [Actinokineospora sp.]|nr:prolyl oligopeptidase family serine peptidase [Actinokineospora sp.]
MRIVARAVTVIAVALAISPGVASADRAEPGLTETEVSFRTADGLTLGGTVFAPADRSGRLPGLLLVHGSGSGGPGYREKLRGEAEAFARQGIVVLAPDKRDKDYSLFHRDFAVLADDAIAAFGVLRDRPEVDPAKAGIWGLSEGGWVAPMAAAKSPDIKFLITAAAPAMTPLRQTSWNVTNKMAASGVGGSLVMAFPYTWHRMISDAGMFAAPYHDPIPTLAALRVPVLALWGEKDTAVPPAETARIFADTVSSPLTVRFLPGAGHAMHQRGSAGERLPTLVPGYADTVGTWVKAVTGGVVPAAHIDPPPTQARASIDVPESAWWESGFAQFAALGVFLLAFGAYPVIALVRRPRGNWAARVLVVSGLLGSFGAVGYLSSLMFSMTEFTVDAGPLLGDRPLLWLLLQALALTALVATLLVARGWRTAPDRARQALLLVGGGLFVPWALYWGLLLP